MTTKIQTEKDLLLTETEDTSMDLIKSMLQKQKESIKQDSFEKDVVISNYNNKKLKEITDKIKTVIDKEVWNEFSFGTISGKILGILRTLNFEYKHRDNLCAELNISPLYIDMYYQFAGNAPYYKNGEVVPERKMDINKTRQLVKRVASELNIIIQDSDLLMINSENEKSRNESALNKANDSKENNTFTQNVNVNITQSENKHMQSLLDA